MREVKRKTPAKRKVPARGKKGRKSLKSHLPLPALNLSNLDKSKNALVMILKDFYAGKVRDKKFRTLCFGFQTLIGYLRLQAEMEWQKKLDEIDRKLGEVMKCT
jgi:hypothetical protein